MRSTRIFVIVFAVGIALAVRPGASPQTAAAPSVAQFLSAASPLEIVSARKADSIAWIAYDQGRRNVYAAAAPLFTPVKVSGFMKDDGEEMTDVNISSDGSTVVFVRGTVPNRDGWNANPSANPDGSEEAIWAGKVAAPGVAWRVAEGRSPVLAPDGSRVLFVKDGQIYGPRISQAPGLNDVDRGEKPYIREWGTNSGPVYSPDGRKIAFVSNRVDHAFIGVLDVATRKVSYLAPDVDRDSNPMWSADGKQITFVRRPGAPFGQQSQAGSGGLGLPAGPAYQPPANAAAGRGGAGQGRGGGGAAQGQAVGAQGQGAAAQGGGRQGNANIPDSARAIPGLVNAIFKGGYNFSFWTADVATGEGHEIWHNQPGENTNFPSMQPAGNHIVFTTGGGGGGRGGGGGGGQPQDEWERYYSLDLGNPQSKPVLLTTTDGIIEDATSIAISPDGTTLFYCTNAMDIERRHIWAVPVAGGQPRMITGGTGIETYPAPLASNRYLATISANWKMPNSVGVWKVPASGNSAPAQQTIVFPTARPGFPADAHVEPQLVITKAPDGIESHNQLFLPKDIKAGERRPAMIFVHGGPVRQMLLGYHYRYVYHMFYGINEWLTSRGYVVLSVNYRGGVGYGRSFRAAPNTNRTGNSEYQDVVAAAKYLQGRPDVDPARVGIYGLSYGGLLTAQALARNSDIFAAGVDYAGVHLYDSSLDPASLSYQSSAISSIDKWKSPVLIIQGDDDRNVFFAQTVGLVHLLRQRDVYYELIVQPDDVHDSLLHSRWVYLAERMDKFLTKFLGSPAGAAGGK